MTRTMMLRGNQPRLQRFYWMKFCHPLAMPGMTLLLKLRHWLSHLLVRVESVTLSTWVTKRWAPSHTFYTGSQKASRPVARCMTSALSQRQLPESMRNGFMTGCCVQAGMHQQKATSRLSQMEVTRVVAVGDRNRRLICDGDGVHHSRKKGYLRCQGLPCHVCDRSCLHCESGMHGHETVHESQASSLKHFSLFNHRFRSRSQ